MRLHNGTEIFECTDNPQNVLEVHTTFLDRGPMANPVFQNRHKKMYYMSGAIPKISKICELTFFAKL